MTKPLAVYTDTDDLDPEPGRKALEAAGFSVVVLQTTDPQQILDKARDATALLSSYAPIDKSLLAQLPRLKIISQLGQGVDNIDVEEATKRGIWVANIDDVASTEVAEHALALILATVRQLKFFSEINGQENWLDRPEFLPRKLSELTLGLIGIGRIGSKLGIKAQPLVKDVLCFDFTQRPNAVPESITRVGSLEEMLPRCDIVSVQIPLRPNTANIINKETLSLLPPASYLVNVGRGGLVDSQAVRAAIDSGQLAGAGIDVFDPEPPPPHHPLLGHRRIITSPHIAYLSESSLLGYIQRQYENVIAWHHTGKPTYPINNL